MDNEQKEFSFYIINIKLQTNKSGDEKTEAYKELIRRLVDKKVHVRVGRDKHAIIYSYYEDKTASGATNFLYGYVGKGIIFDRDGTTIDIQKATSGMEPSDKTKMLQSKVANYVFIPETHRFCLQAGQEITLNNLLSFLNKTLPMVKDEGDEVVVELEHEATEVNQILSAIAVHKLKYRITYTNDDFLGPKGRQLDDRLKRAGIGTLAIDAISDHNGRLDIQNEELLAGGVELARKNGTVAAEITSNNGKKKWVTTEKKPLIATIKATAENFRNYIANYVKQTYRGENNQDEQAV